MITYGLTYLNFTLVEKDLSHFDRFDNPLLMTLFSLSVLAMKATFKLFHLCIYWSNGSGFFFFKLCSTLAALGSQLMLSLMFVLLAFGFGTARKKFQLENMLDVKW